VGFSPPELENQDLENPARKLRKKIFLLDILVKFFLKTYLHSEFFKS
jgi:hypothetical protein